MAAASESAAKQKSEPARPGGQLSVHLDHVLLDFDNTFRVLQRSYLTFEITLEKTCTFEAYSELLNESLRNAPSSDEYKDILGINLQKMLKEEATMRANNLRIMNLMVQCSNHYRALREVSDADRISSRSELNIASRLAISSQEHFLTIKNLLQENVQRMYSFLTIQKFILNDLCSNMPS